MAFMNKHMLKAKIILVSFVIYLSSVYGLTWIRNCRYRGVLIPILTIFFAYGIQIFNKKVKILK